MDEHRKGEKTEKSRKQRRRQGEAEIFTMEARRTDPDGSWTGAPANPREKPVQDADDL